MSANHVISTRNGTTVSRVKVNGGLTPQKNYQKPIIKPKINNDFSQLVDKSLPKLFNPNLQLPVQSCSKQKLPDSFDISQVTSKRNGNTINQVKVNGGLI